MLKFEYGWGFGDKECVLFLLIFVWEGKKGEKEN